MHRHDIAKWQHEHIFDHGNHAAERGTKIVMWLTMATMVVEIAAGWWFNSMALMADGWHMSSHALAFGLSVFAYGAARRYARDPRFAFGSWKIEVLAGYTSAILLLCVAALMVVGSIERLLSPQPIHYPEAMLVAAVGLGVNLFSAYILGDAHHHHDHHHEPHHDHDHGHDRQHGHEQHHDLNWKSAYLHVLADAATSVLALIALAGGWLYGWGWLDPAMGIVGAVVIAVWARGLIRDSGKVLLDREMDHAVVDEIRELMQHEFLVGDTRVVDLHVWRVGRHTYAVVLSVVTHDTALTPEAVKAVLRQHEELAHITVEINPCR